MFWSTNKAHHTTPTKSTVISLLDGIVALATLESYGVVDGRDAPSCDIEQERRARARKRSAARVSCDDRRSSETSPHSSRAARLAGQR
jgi:hypothetical protein